jgi:tRNA threonylcarbamoyl adenosine modification protein (Sua5/YciO/YrdC/YwlC family)
VQGVQDCAAPGGEPKYDPPVARFLDIHPLDPQPRLVEQVAHAVREGALIAYPTDSGYALGCALGNKEGLDRIKAIRRLNDRHHFTLVCSDFAQLGQFAFIGNSAFRLVKSLTPGPYTFILPATKEVPRRMQHPRKKTVGVRIPDHLFVRALLGALGEPLQSSTLILPGHEEAMSEGWQVKEELDALVDIVVEAGDVGTEPTTVIDLSSGEPVVARVGAGDVSRFEAV